MLVSYWYTVEPSACLVFNFEKQGRDHLGQGLVNKEVMVKLLHSHFAKKKKKKKKKEKCNNGRRMGWGIIV